MKTTPLTCACLTLAASQLAFGVEYRSQDGSGNNLSNSTWGQAGSQLMRLTPANYADGMSTVDSTLPNARVISNAVAQQSSPNPDARGLTEWSWVWGQFIDHDIDHSPFSSSTGNLPITIPSGDPVFGSMAGQEIAMSRTNYIAGTGENGIAREHPTMISAYIDGSMIYGGRANDNVDRPAWLRDTSNPGKLKVSDGGAFGDLLPTWEDSTSPGMANIFMPNMGTNAFVTGDVRANENNSLTLIHTIFVREHNRIVDVLAANHPTMDGDQLYDTARKIVTAEVQAITFHEYLPTLGVNINDYQGYDNSLQAGIFTEFSTAAFRLHSQINAVQLRLDAAGNVIAAGNSNLADQYFNPSEFLAGGVDPLVRGLSANVQEANDLRMPEALRSQLFQIFIGGVGLVDNATDLFAIDVQRGRDMGLGSYNDLRIALGLPEAMSFSDVTSDANIALQLSDLYGSIDKLEIFVGLLAEDLTADASIGETTAAIFQTQFELLRDSDRFWYENDLAGINADLLMMAEWDGLTEETAADWLANLTLCDILELNTGVTGLQDNVFFAAAVPEPSSVFLLSLSGLLLARRRRSQK